VRRQPIEHVLNVLDELSCPEIAAGCTRYVVANACEQAKLWLESTVFCLTRSGEQGILGVFRTRKAAEAARDSCFDPSEMRIEAFLVEDGDDA